MQTSPDDRPSLVRMLSCRHSKKVSCETLSINDAFLSSNLQSEAPGFYYSDGEKDHMKGYFSAGDADESPHQIEKPDSDYCSLAHEYLQHARELENHSGKLDNPSYGDDKAAGDNFLSRFFARVSHTPAASRAKEVERLRKHLRTHPNAIRHTGSVLPHSGPILLHIGSFSGSLSSKAHSTSRASSIIPHNAIADKMNAAAGEPFSPKVSCLGSVRNKQKHLRKCTSVASNYTKENQARVCCTPMLSRRTKNARTEFSKKEKKVENQFLAQSKKTDSGKALSSGDKGTMSSRFVGKEESKIWSLRETRKLKDHNISHQHQKSWQGTESSGPRASSSEFSVDMSRFGSESQRHDASMEENLVTGLVSNGSQRFEQDDKEGSVQAVPQNALLLIRSRKVKDPPEVALSINGQETSVRESRNDHVMQKTSSTQVIYMPSSSAHNTNAESLLPLPEVEMKKPATIADILGCDPSLTMQGASATACKYEMFEKRHSFPTEHTGDHRQAPLPNSYPQASIWQRRAIEQPCALDIKKPIAKRPIKAEFNRRTTM